MCCVHKADFVSKWDAMYLFTSCGYFHEKDIARFNFVTFEVAKKRRVKKEIEVVASRQTILFDFLPEPLEL